MDEAAVQHEVLSLEDGISKIKDLAKARKRLVGRIGKAEAKVKDLKGDRDGLDWEILRVLQTLKALGAAPHVEVGGFHFRETVLLKRDASPADHPKVTTRLVTEGLADLCGKPKYSSIEKHFADLGTSLPRWFTRLTHVTEVVRLSVRKT